MKSGVQIPHDMIDSGHCIYPCLIGGYLWLYGVVLSVPRLDRLIIQCGFGTPGGYEYRCTHFPSDAPTDFTKRLTVANGPIRYCGLYGVICRSLSSAQSSHDHASEALTQADARYFDSVEIVISRDNANQMLHYFYFRFFIPENRSRWEGEELT